MDRSKLRDGVDSTDGDVFDDIVSNETLQSVNRSTSVRKYGRELVVHSSTKGNSGTEDGMWRR